MSFTPLTRPGHNAVSIDPNPRDSLSDGFNYPTFHLLNKQARVLLSAPHEVNSIFPYRILAIANSKGWFAAVRTESHGTSIVFSTLQELRTSLKNAKDGENLFVPRRTVRLPAENVNIIAFGMHDARLLVGFTGGQLLVYDAAHLFSAGTNEVAPLNMSKTSSAPFIQILPNPGTEAELARLVAVIRGDGTVQVLDVDKLEAQCGWVGEGEAAPVALSWAPKGKHLAIGLRMGDIITYALSNNTVPHKQIPPTADGYLVSLDWVGPTLVFKSTYSSKIPECSDATLHVVHVDVKSSTGHYFSLMHPFPAADRNKMHALSLSMPKWDEEPGAPAEAAKGILIVGDMSSVDLEVLAYIGPQWYQQPQENPLQLPLDKDMNDTILMSLETDLTDVEENLPLMYAYLNDGTLQGWKLDHSRPYVGMVKAGPLSTFDGPVIAQESPAFAAAFSPPSTPTRSRHVGGTSTFGQSSTSPFQQTPTASSFGPQAAYGQASTGTPSIFEATKGTSDSAFGGFNQPFGPSAAPQPATSETITREASMSDETTSLGGLSLVDDRASTPPKSGGGGVFGSFSPSPSTPTPVFGGIVKPATGFGAFNHYQNTTPSVAKNDTSQSPFAATESTPSAPTHSAFGSQGFAKPVFGQPSFGQPSFGQTSFPTSTTPRSGGFNGFASDGPTALNTPSKPAPGPVGSGFAAFTSTQTAFATTTTPASEPPKSSAFPGPAGGAFERSAERSKKDALKSSAMDESPPSSPEPMAGINLALTVDDDMSPPASPIKRDSASISRTPAQRPPATAFSNLSTPIRPASGFGAFGGIPESSPFFKKPDVPTTPSAFEKQLLSTTPANTPPGNSSPKFGATSLPGVKSAFAPVVSTTQTKASSSGGSGAFSDTSGGFASFAGGGKSSFSDTSGGFASFTGSGKSSFSELLKAADPESDVHKDKGIEKPMAALLSESATPVTPKKEDQPTGTETSLTPVFTSPEQITTTPVAEPSQNMVDKDREPIISKKKPISAEESFVEVTLEEGEIIEESGTSEAKEENEDYLSGSLGPSDSEGSIDGSDEEDEEQDEFPTTEDTGTSSRASVDPAMVPLPISRSPSAAPEVPSTVVSTESAEKPLKESSTTPSGTPTKPTTIEVPKPVPSTTPAGQPLSVGLGRPSTRPMRSSPLAGEPVIVQDQVERQKSEVTKPTTPPLKPTSTESAEKVDSAQDLKAPRPRGVSSLATVSAPMKPPAPVSLLANTAMSLNKAEPPNQPTGVFREGFGIFGGASAQNNALGRPVQATSPTLPSTIKAEAAGAPSPDLLVAPQRPMSSPLSFSPPTPRPSGLNRPASVPPSIFNKTPTTADISPFSVKGATNAPGKPLVHTPQKPSPPLEEGMQKECTLLYSTMNQELQELRQLAQEANRKRQELSKSNGGSHRKADLGNSSKWGLVDAQHFGQVLKQFGRDLSELRELRGDLKQKVRQAEGRMLRAGTRKEEIARFTKAQNDKEFVKMLKSRTLGPEHLESQTQLRRSIRAIRDRIQKVEAHLQASQKKLAEANSGKPSFRAPTLDTINRTYRNIDLAIQYQADEIAQLSERTADLDLTTLAKTTKVKALPSPQRDPRLPDNGSRRPFNVTPHIAISTAAALNAERSAQKLKKALLTARKAPLLNDKAAQATPARIVFKTPQRVASYSTGSGFAFNTPISGPLFSAETPQTPIPEWTFSEDDLGSSPSPPTRRGAGRTKKHATNIPLKKGTVTSQASPSFDWGPLPRFNQPALASIGSPVKLEPTNPEGFVPLTQKK
ncbi:hypothetical protein APHAL10511_007405 [Amanita phalloides]|nr:hypothetical protein APHAL10511_007405 [Amanita phalloides]